MKKRILRLNLKRIGVIIQMLSMLLGNFGACGMQVHAEESNEMVESDQIPPVLERVTYIPEGSAVKIGEKNYRFYQAAVKAHLDLLESDFPDSVHLKENLPVYSGNALLSGWNFEPSKNLAVGDLEFPLKEQEETEYQYDVFYKDFAGNLMVGNEKIVCVDGRYESEVIVVDSAAPILKQFMVESEKEGNSETQNRTAYAKITVVIDDHAEYFQPEAVRLEYSMDGKQWNRIKVEQSWQAAGREHTLVCKFDGEMEKEGVYQFRITYKDRAGNEMILENQEELQIKIDEDGSYRSYETVLLDHSAPKISSIEASAPIQVDEEERKIYYDDDAKVTFTIQDAYLNRENIKLEIYHRKNADEDWRLWEQEAEDFFQKNGTDNIYQLMIPSDEGEYYFQLFCRDEFQNQIMYSSKLLETGVSEVFLGEIKDGSYQSPIFAKDTTAPEVRLSNEQEANYYFRDKNVKTKIVITEKNLDLENTLIFVSAKDINGNMVKEACPKGFSYDSEIHNFCASWEELKDWIEIDESSGEQTFLLETSVEAHYVIEAVVKDKVNKMAEVQSDFCVDRSAPYITVVTREGKTFTNEVNVSSGILDSEKSDVKYTVKNDGWFSRIINKITFGYFAKEKVIVCVSVRDETSGVATLEAICLHAGKEMLDYKISEPQAVKGDESVVQYEIELPGDFKGTVQMHGIDKAQNKAKDTGAIGVISETEKQHEKNAKTNLEILTPYSKTPGYYAGNVTVKFDVADGYSGLYEVNYLAGTYQENVIYPAGEEIRLEVSKKHIIDAGSNNHNHIELGLEFEDQAGYVESFPKEQLPVIHIDKTKPVIQVVYDDSEVLNEKYYKAERRADVIITERNFDPKDTELLISGPTVTKSDWKHLPGERCAGSNDPSDTHHTDNCRWSSTILFSEDGEYSLTCHTADLAGNEAVYGQTDVFVLDQTLPQVKVTYDNYEALNERYYRAPRIAVIEIIERNFDAADVILNLTAKDGETEIKKPAVQSWQKEGELHRATITYDYDGEFTFSMKYTDLAGNRAEEIPADAFVIDLTVPEIEISGVQDRSANNGTVAPVINCTDRNYDTERTVVEVSGQCNGSVEWKGTETILKEGMELRIEDFEHIPQMDDLYSLYVYSYDLAGNKSEKMLTFSVNRFGSVYTFDEATEKLVGAQGTYYTAEEPEIVVYETNVDTLEFQKITRNLNGELLTLKEGEHFEVIWNEIEHGWKQYTYRIQKENFTEEGIYVLTIYSEDRAKNQSDNQNKGKKIEFVVDKTSPRILITGIEDKKQYREHQKEMMIDVEDNVCVEKIEVILDGSVNTYEALEIAETNGKIKLLLKDGNDWQTLMVRGYDAAGNSAQTEEIRFLITANPLIQFYRNQPLFYASIGSVMAGSIFFWLFWKKRKETFVSS